MNLLKNTTIISDYLKLTAISSAYNVPEANPKASIILYFLVPAGSGNVLV